MVLGGEARSFNGDAVLAEGEIVEVEFALGIAGGGLKEVGSGGADEDVGAFDGTKTVAEARAVRIRTALASEVQNRGKFVSPSQQGGGWISIAELRDFLSLRDEV